MRIVMGGYNKTTNLMIEYGFPVESDSYNEKRDRDVASWIAKSEKILNKKKPEDVVKLLFDQFEFLTYLEVRDYAHRLAKGAR